MGKNNAVLRFIYALVLAVAYGLFVGVTIYTFYPMPENNYNYSRYDTCSNYDYSSDQYTDCQNEIDDNIRDNQDSYEEEMKSWSTNVGVFLLIVSSLVIFISIYLNEKLEIISNGLLLGSLITLIASVGFSFGSGNKILSFVFSLIVLGVTIAVGYIKLIGRRKNEEIVNTVQQPPVVQVASDPEPTKNDEMNKQ